MSANGSTPATGSKMDVLLAIFDFPMLNVAFQTVIDAEPDMRVVGVAENQAAMLEQIGTLNPDVVITECLPYNGRGCTSFAAIEAIRGARPTTKIIALECLQSGQTLTVTVRVTGSSASLMDDDDAEGEVEFEGKVDSVGASSMVVAGRTVHVDASTRLVGHEGTPIALSDFQPGDLVEVEGTARPDGSVLALKVKLEDDEDDDDSHGQEVEFEGTITVLAPLTIGGRLVTTDGSTMYFGRQKETLTAADVLKIGSRVEVEGFQQPDNSVLARKIKLED